MVKHTRLWEIDFLRGVALLLMVGYHFVFDLALVGLLGFFPVGGVWNIFIWSVASLFLALVGVSMWLRRQKSDSAFIKRGLQILGWGVVISVVTYAFDPTTFVRFGILHLIGLAVILSAPLVKHRQKTLVVFTGIWLVWLVLWLTTGFQVECGQCGQPPFFIEWLLMVLGFWPAAWQTLDYYPLLPWWGVVTAGLVLGRRLYPDQNSSLFEMPRSTIVTWIRFLGRHALLIYLAHQPVLLLFVWILAKALEH